MVKKTSHILHRLDYLVDTPGSMALKSHLGFAINLHGCRVTINLVFLVIFSAKLRWFIMVYILMNCQYNDPI